MKWMTVFEEEEELPLLDQNSYRDENYKVYTYGTIIKWMTVFEELPVPDQNS